jgi:predicted phosphodiesterase
MGLMHRQLRRVASGDADATCIMKILILSDIHGNWPALQAVLEAESGIEAFLCLGDLVNYGPQPVECVRWAVSKSNWGWFIQGNHDWSVAHDQDPRCSTPFQHLAEVTRQFTRSILGEHGVEFLRALPPKMEFELDGRKCFACHGTPLDPLFRYFNYAHPQSVHLEVEAAGSPEFLFLGHTHIPCDIRSFGTRIINPGSVGQPKDGDSRAAYAVWDNGQIELKRAAYDIEATIKEFRTEHLRHRDVRQLAEVLRTGGHLPWDGELHPGD